MSTRCDGTSAAAGTATTNAAAAQWNSVTGGYGLLITLVSSDSLAEVRLQNPLGNAADLCSSAGGAPTGSPIRIPGIPGAAAGSCAFRPQPPGQRRGRCRLRTGQCRRPHRDQLAVEGRRRPSLTVQAAHDQYAALPPGGVPVSSGGLDVEWIVLWLCILAVLACASWRAPAEEGAGGGPSRRSPKPSDGEGWPSGFPSWR